MSIFAFPSGGSSDMKLIFSTTLTSDADTISTGTLATGYRDLVLVTSLRSDRVSPFGTGVNLEFNGDTSVSNYQYVRMGVQNATPFGQSSNSSTFITNTTSLDSGNVQWFSGSETRIFDYESNTKYKSYLTIDTSQLSSTMTNNFVNHIGSVWRNTAAITSILLRISTAGAGFAAGSKIAVYGVK